MNQEQIRKSLLKFFTLWCLISYIIVVVCFKKYKIIHMISTCFLLSSSILGMYIIRNYIKSWEDKYNIDRCWIIFMDIIVHLLPLIYVCCYEINTLPLIKCFNSDDYYVGYLYVQLFIVTYLYFVDPRKIYHVLQINTEGFVITYMVVFVTVVFLIKNYQDFATIKKN